MSTTATRSTTARKPAAPGRKPGVRELAAQETQENILRAATRIFAKHGFSGGRVDQISKAAKSHDRMIYYYFGSKEGLYIAVLEDLYRRFNDAEAALKFNVDKPEEALVAVISSSGITTTATPSSSPYSMMRTCIGANTFPSRCARASTRRQPYRCWNRCWPAACSRRCSAAACRRVTSTS